MASWLPASLDTELTRWQRGEGINPTHRQFKLLWQISQHNSLQRKSFTNLECWGAALHFRTLRVIALWGCHVNSLRWNWAFLEPGLQANEWANLGPSVDTKWSPWTGCFQKNLEKHGIVQKIAQGSASWSFYQVPAGDLTYSYGKCSTWWSFTYQKSSFSSAQTVNQRANSPYRSAPPSQQYLGKRWFISWFLGDYLHGSIHAQPNPKGLWATIAVGMKPSH